MKRPLPCRRVLIVSASMGGGHDGAARELARRIEARGHRAKVMDFLEALPLGSGRLLRALYVFQLRYLAWSYELTYRLWYLLPPLVVGLVGLANLISRRRLLRWIEEWRPDVVVSTYPLPSLVLGQLRLRNRLTIPAATFLCDFAVHPLWVHVGIDLHLAVHPSAAEEAVRRTGGAALAPGPLVRAEFLSEKRDRTAARVALGLDPHVPAVLVVAGAWAVGGVEATVEEIAGSGRYIPVVVCGSDERLRRRLQSRRLGVVLGWTDDMPGLMTAVDALVENAGGLTCMEAIAAGVPVVSYRPLPGHGRDNAAAMAAEGVTLLAGDVGELLTALDDVVMPGPTRAQLTRKGRAMFAGDAAAAVLKLAEEAATTSSAPTEPVAARR